MATESEGGGGATDLVGVAAAESAAAAAADKAAPGEGADPEFLGLLSAEGGDADNPSNRDYIKAKGYKDLDGVVKSYRAAEKAIHDKGRVAVPSEGASDEERTAYAKAIGVPDKPEDYQIEAPLNGSFDPNRSEGPDNPKHIPLNEPLIAALRVSAVKNGTPKAAFEGIVKDFIAAQLDEAEAEKTKQDGLAQGKIKEWGAKSTEKIANVDTAARALGLSKADMAGLRTGLGADRALDILAKLGEGMAEDTIIGGGGTRRFGVTGAEAKAELDRLKTDDEFQKKVMVLNSPERARWDRLNTAAAEWQAAQNKEA